MYFAVAGCHPVRPQARLAAIAQYDSWHYWVMHGISE
jgi:hypothetical protein